MPASATWSGGPRVGEHAMNDGDGTVGAARAPMVAPKHGRELVDQTIYDGFLRMPQDVQRLRRVRLVRTAVMIEGPDAVLEDVVWEGHRRHEPFPYSTLNLRHSTDGRFERLRWVDTNRGVIVAPLKGPVTGNRFGELSFFGVNGWDNRGEVWLGEAGPHPCADNTVDFLLAQGCWGPTVSLWMLHNAVRNTFRNVKADVGSILMRGEGVQFNTVEGFGFDRGYVRIDGGASENLVRGEIAEPPMAFDAVRNQSPKGRRWFYDDRGAPDAVQVDRDKNSVDVQVGWERPAWTLEMADAKSLREQLRAFRRREHANRYAAGFPTELGRLEDAPETVVLGAGSCLSAPASAGDA